MISNDTNKKVISKDTTFTVWYRPDLNQLFLHDTKMCAVYFYSDVLESCLCFQRLSFKQLVQRGYKYVGEL